jgi:hypothetical protein
MPAKAAARFRTLIEEHADSGGWANFGPVWQQLDRELHAFTAHMSRPSRYAAALDEYEIQNRAPGQGKPPIPHVRISPVALRYPGNFRAGADRRPSALDKLEPTAAVGPVRG